MLSTLVLCILSIGYGFMSFASAQGTKKLEVVPQFIHFYATLLDTQKPIATMRYERISVSLKATRTDLKNALAKAFTVKPETINYPNDGQPFAVKDIKFLQLTTRKQSCS